ncbi:MAG: E3 ubiquitin ligase family protein [Elainellaceae cyanobacterium]
MKILGFILLIVSGILFFVKKQQGSKSFSVKSARPVQISELKQLAGEIADEIGGGNWRDYVKVYGTVLCDRPLTSELKQQPCVYYRMSVKRRYEEIVTRKDESGKTQKTTSQRTQTVASNQQSVPFRLRDRHGDEIEVNPTGADIETIKVVSEFQPEGGNHLEIRFGGFSQTLGTVTPRANTKTLGYEYSESLLPVDRQMLVIGTASDVTGELVLQRPVKSDKKFIISLKSDEELAANADQGAKMAFYGMVGCGVMGLLLIVIGVLS